MKAVDLLPPGVPPFVYDWAQTVFDRLDELMAEAGVPATMQNPDTCPEPYLPLLAWGLGMPAWDESLSVETKRARIKAWPETAKKLGTRGAVRRALEALDFPIRLLEWFEDNPQGEPGTFCIDVDVIAGPVSAQTQNAVFRTAMFTKKLSAHIAKLRWNTTAPVTYHAGAFTKTGFVLKLPTATEGV